MDQNFTTSHPNKAETLPKEIPILQQQQQQQQQQEEPHNFHPAPPPSGSHLQTGVIPERHSGCCEENINPESPKPAINPWEDVGSGSKFTHFL